MGGGSNAIGIFHAFRNDPGVRLFGFEAGGEGIESGRHAAKLSVGSSGVLHGARSYLLQDDEGQTIASHSISAGLGLSLRWSGARLAARHRQSDV